MPYIFYETLIIAVICDKCGSNDENLFKKIKKEESNEMLKILGLSNNSVLFSVVMDIKLL